MTDLDSGILHRFLAHCRLLMAFQPASGARLYDIKLGRVTHRPGWNVIHRRAGSNKPTAYMFVHPESGMLTNQKPDVPEEELNDVYEPEMVSLHGTAAWRQLCCLRDEVEKERGGQASIEHALVHVERLEQYPVVGSADTVEGYLTRFKQHVDTTSTRPCSLDEFFLPVRTVVQSFLNFEESGGHVAQVLDWILRYSSQLPSVFSLHSDGDRWFLCAEHLRDLTYSLLSDRNERSLSGFLDMTSLALLYGNTAYHIYTHLIDSGLLEAQEHTKLARNRLALDEKMAHDAGPTLLHPVTYMPFGMLEHGVSRRGFTPMTGIYPGALRVQDKPFSAEKVWDAIQSYSRSARPALSRDALMESYPPVAPQLEDHVTGFLLGLAGTREFDL